MSHFSPAVVLLWAIISALLLVFLVWHLWKFDRFASLGWKSNSSRTGGFKRLMTYSYLCSVPLLLFYSITFAIIKYNEGYFLLPSASSPISPNGTTATNTTVSNTALTAISDVLHHATSFASTEEPYPVHGGGKVVPLPYQLWGNQARSWILALYIAFSVSWALEVVSHLEELNFWLFLMSPSAPRSWFRSVYFFTWITGSIAAIVGLPVTAVVTRHDPTKSEAWIFFVGSVSSFIITVVSLRVLWLFPRFIQLLRKQGADPETIVRLTTYNQLNNVRVLFRFLFVVPLLILAIDGIRPTAYHTVNEDGFATDFLAMVAGIGCIVQSGLTLLVFFPRSIAQESGYVVLAQVNSFSGGSVPAPHEMMTGERRPSRTTPVGERSESFYPRQQYPESIATHGRSLMPTPMPTHATPSIAGDDLEMSEVDRRKVAQEWIALQEQQQHSAQVSTRGIAFGTRAMKQGERPRSFGGASLAESDGGASESMYSTAYTTTVEGGPSMRSPRSHAQPLPIDTSSPPASGNTPPPPHGNHPPPSYSPPSPVTPQGSAPPHRRPLLPTAPALPTVIEPDHESVGSTTPLPSAAAPFAAQQSNQHLNSGGAAGGSFGRKRESQHMPGSPFEYDYIDLDTKKRPEELDGEGKASTSRGAGRNRNELANVPFDEMRARGSRYAELHVRRAVARGEEGKIHPYLRSFKSPLDLYDQFGNDDESPGP